MDRARNLPKIGDQTKERSFGYVYGVSGPGELTLNCSYFGKNNLLALRVTFL